ncbi:MAG: type II secretion system major pseudopilin GspG [Nitrospirota bacterium]
MKESYEKTKRRRAEGGFTLIELIVVLVILSLLAAVVAPKMLSRAEDAKVTDAKVQMRNLETALKLFKLDNGFYPTTEQGLEALVEKPSTGRIPKNYREEGYLEKSRVPLDPWGNPFIYVSPGQNDDYEIVSMGADGQEGGEGHDADLQSWNVQ